MDGELSKDEMSNIPQDIFINEIYNITLDKTIVMINKRYNHTEDILKSLAYFSPNRFDDEYPSDLFKKIASWLTTVDEYDLNSEFKIFKNNFQQLHTKYSSSPVNLDISNLFVREDKLDSEEENDFNNEKIEFEENVISKSTFKITEVLKLLSAFGLNSGFPNVYKVYKAICTLPPTSATAERSFSKLKLIKTKHRSTMDESRLDHLMVISCSPDINLNIEKAIDKFAMKSNLLRTALLYQ